MIDRRQETWQEAQSVFEKIISLFPAKIKEVFLIYQYTSGGSQIDYLLVVLLSHFQKHQYLVLVRLLMTTCLTLIFTTCPMLLRLATFVKVLKQEDISQLDNYDFIKEVNN